MKLQHKIAAAYIATLGIAVTGTTIGLLLGRQYQQKALASWDAVLEEYTLFNQLQFKILYNRPTEQLLPCLQDPQNFQQAIAAFQERLKEIETMLEKYQQLDTVDHQSAQQRSLFYNYQQTIADFSQKLKVLGATVESLSAEAKQSKIAEQELINLTQSPEFLRFIEFPDQLVDLTSETAKKLNRAEWELWQAEKFRAQIATTSLLISMAIAALAAIYFSRAIAHQQFAWEAERTSNQQKLQESYIRLQMAMEIGNMGTWDWQPQTNQVAFSREWKAMLGYAEDEIGNSIAEWQSRVHPEDIESALAETAKHIRGEVPIYEKEHRLRCKDGTYKWILARGQIIERDAQGQPLRFLGVHYDISERKAAEIQLSELSQQLKKAQEVAHLGYWSFDLISQKITWSEEVFRIFGLDPHQGEPSFEENLQLYHPEDRDLFLARVAEANQGIPQNFDARIVRPTGEIRYTNARIEVDLRDGAVVRMFGIVIDITDRKTEEALRSLLSRTQLLNYISTEIRNSLDLETILDRAVNAIFVELKVDICTFAWYRREPEPPVWEVVKEEKIPAVKSWLGTYNIEQFPELFSRVLEEQVYSCDFRVSKDTSLKAFCQESNITFYLSIPIQIGKQIVGGFELGRISSDQPWQDDEIALLQSIGTQVAIAIQQAQLYQESQAKTQELQKAYHELQATQMQLIQAEKMSSLGQLVAGVAHEINNPVSFIYGNLTPISQYTDDLLSLLQLYEECYPNPPEKITNFMADIELDFLIEDLPKTIKSIETGAERIRDIVKSLRTFSRLDEADLKAVDLHENIDSTLVILQNRFNGKNGKAPINIVKNYGDLPLFECYIGLLNQVFMNLLVNAIQAIEKRQEIETNPEYTGHVTITTTLNSDRGVSISVKDNGVGMSPEVQAKIFNPFFTTKPVGQGTGMGLPISYQIVTKNHQGELTFTSVLGEGTEFIIYLPFR